MNANNGTPYETLTQQIFQRILNQDGVKTINVQHDITLDGKTATHQIDVYWEFEAAGIVYKTIVQAKDWARPVDQGELLKFKAVLDDLPDQPRGIFVSRSGYQSGAIEFAKNQGIPLYELRKPTDEDWKGRIRTIRIQMNIIIPSTKVELVADHEWLRQEINRLQLAPNEIPSISNEKNIHEDSLGSFLVYDDLSKSSDVKEILHDLCRIDYNESTQVEGSQIEKCHHFSDQVFLKTDNSKLPLIKIQSIKVHIIFHKTIVPIEIRGDELIAFILQNTLDGTRNHFGPDLYIR